VLSGTAALAVPSDFDMGQFVAYRDRRSITRHFRAKLCPFFPGMQAASGLCGNRGTYDHLMHYKLTREGRKNRPFTAGFTLIELLIAAALAAILLSAIFSGISNSFALLNTTRERMRGTQIMMSRLEGLRLESWGSGTNHVSQLFNPTMVPNTFTDYFYPEGLNGNTNSLGTVYTGSLSITTNVALTPSCSYSNFLAFVTVSVQWQDCYHGATNNHSDSMSTLVGRYGIQNYVYTH
jgi:prepilin-type N-terminal cleavage/methylation domain-containing protein